MPKQSKSKGQSKTGVSSKTKRKVQPKAPSITTKKWYWVFLAGIMVTVFSVVGYMMKLGTTNVAFLMLTIIFLFGLMGYVGTTPSVLSKSKRATFLFVGASVIGFGFWAIIVLVSTAAELIENIFANTFFIIPSLILCMIIGAFIGELLGKNKRVQTFFFKPKDTS